MSAAPDLSAAEGWLAQRTPRERKQRGQWVTPWSLVHAVVERAVKGLGERPLVVDPACGDARFLVAVARARPDARLVGIDADPLAIEAARATLQRAGVEAELRCADALTQPSGARCGPASRPPPTRTTWLRASWSTPSRRRGAPRWCCQ